MAYSLSEVFTNGNPYLESLGVEVVEYGDGKAVMALKLQPEFMNSWHVAQGGISMTLMDVAMGLAARTAIPDAKSSATVDMSTSFLQPAGKAGETIVARGKAYHRSTTMCFCEAELWNGDQLVAKALGTFKAIKRVDIAKKLTHEAHEAHDRQAAAAAPASSQQD
ncbi:PaaI family thioesterase [Herbaspirillum rhizosphaerae]|uniref:PaaI family thioesterase n=1 Tax=Herbaspirillum rhizosphaerae TaxID=346179 RepID=UPI00067E0E56|nr:PaaI family thioesterase [Herbaspirillum rhizosphaerae]